MTGQIHRLHKWEVAAEELAADTALTAAKEIFAGKRSLLPGTQHLSAPSCPPAACADLALWRQAAVIAQVLLLLREGRWQATEQEALARVPLCWEPSLGAPETIITLHLVGKGSMALHFGPTMLACLPSFRNLPLPGPY